MYTVKTVRGSKEYHLVEKKTWLDAFCFASEIVQNQRGDSLRVEIIKWGRTPGDDTVEATYYSGTCKWNYRGN